jgi:type I restriction-modification system DNA methylase subunit
LAARNNNKKSNTSLSKKIANYTLDSPNKITFEFLKSHLGSAADILRGSLDASEYRQPVMTLLFLKRLNDTFEENAEKLIKKGMNKKKHTVKEDIIFIFRIMLDGQYYPQRQKI